MAAKRSPNFTESEKEIFLTVLLPKYKEVIENKKTDALTNSEKAAAWLSLTLDFNTISTVYKRTENNLKNLWDTLKKNAKKAHNSQRTDILKPDPERQFSPMVGVNVNVETLIQEVRNRPVIWDVNHEHYNDRFRTQLAWYNICTVLLENFRQKSKIEKSNITRRMALRWKILKENYTQKERKRRRDGSARKYVYAEQMSFLYDTISCATQSPSESLDNNEHFHFQQQQEVDDESIYDNPTASEHQPMSAIDTYNSRRQYLPSGYQAQDEDLAFFHSLIPTVRSLNEDKKLEFRIAVLEALKRIKRQPNYCPNNEQILNELSVNQSIANATSQLPIPSSSSILGAEENSTLIFPTDLVKEEI